MLTDMCIYRDCLLSPSASEPLVNVNKPKALLTTNFLVTDELYTGEECRIMRRKGKLTSSRETRRGQYVCLLFASSKRTVDKLNTVLPTSVTASDYAKFTNCLPPEGRVFQGGCNIVLSCRLIRVFSKIVTTSAVYNMFTVKLGSILLRYIKRTMYT